MTTDVAKAIHKINPEAGFVIKNNDVNQIEWNEETTPIPVADIEAKMAEIPTEEEEIAARKNLKASAKAKLIAGEPLTEEESDTIVL